jgi:hypothetical protein
VLQTLLGGEIENAPDAGGNVQLGEKEARAILYIGLSLSSKITSLFEGFVEDYGAARKASVRQVREAAA